MFLEAKTYRLKQRMIRLMGDGHLRPAYAITKGLSKLPDAETTPRFVFDLALYQLVRDGILTRSRDGYLLIEG